MGGALSRGAFWTEQDLGEWWRGANLLSRLMESVRIGILPFGPGRWKESIAKETKK